MVTMALGVIEAVETINQINVQGTGQNALMASAEMNMFRGAIIGALIVGVAFLTGLAVLRRGALAYSSAFMVGTAAALELFWLGFLPAPSANLVVLLQGIFGASVIIFLSASIRLARHHAGLGGIMFAASLVFVGVGIINFLGRADFSAAMIRGLIGVSVFTLGLSAFQAMRGDRGARLVFPGALLVAMSAAVFISGFGGPLLGHGLLTLGLLASSFVVLSEKNPASIVVDDFTKTSPLAEVPSGAQSFADKRKATNIPTPSDFAPQDSMAFSEKQGHRSSTSELGKSGRKPAISGERLVEVLDFSGIGVWDWSVDGVYQSDSLCEMLGADCEANFTPEALRAFIMPSHLGIFEAEILGHSTGDGGFDTQIVLHNGQIMRLRGARAVDSAGRLERVVAFFEAPMSPSDLASSSVMNEKSIDGNAAMYLHSATETAAKNNTLESRESEGASVTSSLAQQSIPLAATPVKAIASGEVVGFNIHIGSSTSKPDSILGVMDWDHGDLVSKAFADSAAFLADCHEQGRKDTAGIQLASDAFVSFPIQYEDIARAGNVERIRDAIAQSGLPYGSLVLALTGLDQIADVASAKTFLGQLRQAGARLAFADAMAGRAVLGNLHRYDFDCIKIDRDLVANAQSNKQSAEMMRTLVALGRDLGLRVIADGVDSETQRKAVEALGCSFACGHMFGTELVAVNRNTLHTEQNLDVQDQTRLDAKGASLENDGTSLDELSSTTFPSRTPDYSASSQAPALSEASRDKAEGVSLDDLSLEALAPGNQFATGGQLAARHQNSGEAPIKNIEAAFAKTVPTFGTDNSRESQPLMDASAPETSLPKWRTWVKNMR